MTLLLPGTKVKIFGQGDIVGTITSIICSRQRYSYWIKFNDRPDEEWPEEWVIPIDEGCAHLWDLYVGLQKIGHYCTKCGILKK